MTTITILAIGVLINSLTILWLNHTWNKRIRSIMQMLVIQGEIINELIDENNEQGETRNNHAEAKDYQN